MCRFSNSLKKYLIIMMSTRILVCLLFLGVTISQAQVPQPKDTAKPVEKIQLKTAVKEQPTETQKSVRQSEIVDPLTKANSPLAVAELYYQAADLDTMNRALVRLRQEWPKHFLRWELETVHQELIKEDQTTSLAAFSALEAVSNQEKWSKEAWPMLPRALYAWPAQNSFEFSERLHRLIKVYPQREMQAALAWSARHIAHFMGNDLAFTQSSQQIGLLLPLHIIGTWDNDQGKGLDAIYPPETELNPQGKYQGKLTEVTWRSDYPKDLRGKINFGDLVSPSRWQVAYGASVIQVRKAQDAELRISTSDPIKVWVNDQLIFSAARIDGWLFDGITLPIKLQQGPNRILIKSAQQTGGWLLTARVTKPNGFPLVYETKPLDTPVQTSNLPPVEVLNETFITKSYQKLFTAEAPARRDFHTLHLLEESGLKVERLQYAEAVAKRFPNSLWLKVARATALWENSELGQAADLIAQLYKLVKDNAEAPYLIGLQTRFWRQQRLDVKARAAARELLEKKPNLVFSYRHLAALLALKGWQEEQCSYLYQGERLSPTDRSLQVKLVKCEKAIGRHSRAKIRNQKLWSRFPKLTSTLDERYQAARLERDYASMIAIGEDCIKSWPQRPKCYSMRAKGLWESERTTEALNALNALQQLNPLSAFPYKQKGDWLIVLGNVEGAIEAWEKAIELDPDDQDLVLRLSELKPKGSEPWLVDVPSDEYIREVLAKRDEVVPAEGADKAYLIDDDVTLIKPDGSTETVVTQVIHAFNQEGRDDLTKMYVGRGRRTQLMAAYAISPDGTRVEASSIRKGVVRFRQLKIGSTVVVQYRNSEPPASYLVGHISKSWWFQNSSTQVLDSRWVLWMPKDTVIKELARKANALEKIEEMKRTEEDKGELKRVMWRMQNLPPVQIEPRMPPLFGQIASLRVSTVPSWTEVFKWEKELLRDAFRVSPEVEKLSQELFADDMSTEDRFYKIQDYVTRNIRYQQDYEHTIAGVKPHTAAQVLARQYGDCKDKAVLFITLAKTIGLKADFALVRTRDSGTVDKEIPSQQFNHAIVYVPSQEGFPQGRFFDPTVDALDVQTLRSDDQGTLSLVYDPRHDKHYWQDIPFQDSSFDESEDQVSIKITSDSKVTGKLLMRSKGQVGQIIRKRARNPENLKQVMQYRVNQLLPGAKMKEHKAVQVDNLYVPAEAEISFEHDNWVRKEGESLRIPSIVDWTPKGSFQLEERRFPLVLGHKRQWHWVLKAELPENYDLSHLPKDRKVGGECLSVERSSTWDVQTRSLHIRWTYLSLCEQLTTQEYQKYRVFTRDMIQLLNEDVVLTPQAKLSKQ